MTVCLLFLFLLFIALTYAAKQRAADLFVYRFCKSDSKDLSNLATCYKVTGY